MAKLSRQRLWQLRKQAEGKCITCGVKHHTGKTRCLECYDKICDYNRDFRDAVSTREVLHCLKDGGWKTNQEITKITGCNATVIKLLKIERELHQCEEGMRIYRSVKNGISHWRLAPKTETAN